MTRPLLVLLALAAAALGCAESDSSTGQGAPSASEAGTGLTILDPQDPDRPYFWGLGTIPHGEVIDHEIQLRNDDPQPVLLQDVLTGCGCTVPYVRWQTAEGQPAERKMRSGSEPIELQPGGVATIALRIDSTQVKVTGKPKLVNVRIRSSASSNPFLTLELSFTIDKPFTVSPAAVRLTGVPQSGVGSAEVTIACDLEEAYEITQVLSKPAFVDTELEYRSETFPPIWVLKVTMKPRFQTGSLQDEIVLGTTGPYGQGEGRPFAVPLHAEIVDDVTVSPKSLQLPNVVPGSEVAAAVDVRALLAGHRLKVLDWRIVGPAAKHLVVDVAPKVDVDEHGRSPHWRVHMTSAAGLAEAEFKGEVVLATDDPLWSEIRIPYGGTVAN